MTAPPTPQADSPVLQSVWPKMNKQDDLVSYIQQLEQLEFHHLRCVVIETVCLTLDEWFEFVNSLLHDRPWLAGKGYSSDVAHHHCLLVVRPGETPAESLGILVDPQGYNYARYVGFYFNPETRLVTNPPHLPCLADCMDSQLMGVSFKDRVLQQAAASVT